MTTTENTTPLAGAAMPPAQKAKPKKKAAKRSALPQPRSTVARTVSVSSDRLSGFLKYAFPERQDLRLHYALSFARPFVGARAVEANAKLLTELIGIQAAETAETIKTLATLESRAKEAGKQLAVGGKRRALEITISTRVAYSLLDLVELLDQAILGAEALWICGVLPDDKRGQLINTLLERANKVQRSIEEIHRKTQAAVAAARAKKSAAPEVTTSAANAPAAPGTGAAATPAPETDLEAA